MEPVFAKMKEVRNKRKAANNYENTKKRIISEKCQHINPTAKYPEQYIQTCEYKKGEAKDICLEYRRCALDSTKNIPDQTLNFNLGDTIPDFTFPIHNALNIPVSYSALNDYNSADVLHNMMDYLKSWPYALEETTFIVMLGTGNILKQHLLLEPDISKLLEKRKHTLIFNIDPEFRFGTNVNSNTLLKALNNNSHPFWKQLGQRFKISDAPKISEPYPKFKILKYTRDDGHTFTYVFIKSFANIFLIHSFFWPKNYMNVYKVYINLLASNPKDTPMIRKFLFNIYDEIYNQSGQIHIDNVLNNNIRIYRRSIEGGGSKTSKKRATKRKTRKSRL